MLKVFKYLKNSGFIIFIIMLLLAGQASCELSLPTYTSNIINIGIQQGGIENPAPKVIRVDEMDKLFIFMSEKNKDIVLDNYKLLSKDKCISKFGEDKLSERLVKINDINTFLLSEEGQSILALTYLLSNCNSK